MGRTRHLIPKLVTRDLRALAIISLFMALAALLGASQGQPCTEFFLLPLLPYAAFLLARIELASTGPRPGLGRLLLWGGALVALSPVVLDQTGLDLRREWLDPQKHFKYLCERFSTSGLPYSVLPSVFALHVGSVVLFTAGAAYLAARFNGAINRCTTATWRTALFWTVLALAAAVDLRFTAHFGARLSFLRDPADATLLKVSNLGLAIGQAAVTAGIGAVSALLFVGGHQIATGIHVCPSCGYAARPPRCPECRIELIAEPLGLLARANPGPS